MLIVQIWVKYNMLCYAWYLFDPMDSSSPGPSVHGDSPGKNTGVGCHVLLQGKYMDYQN